MKSFESSVIETIRERRSIRSYSDEPIMLKLLDELLIFANNHSTGPFGNQVRFQLVNVNGFDTKSIKNLGTYGAIKGARHYLVGIIKNEKHSMEDFGFCMETAILKATSLGLGTCWLGGFLNRSTFGELCKIATDDIIPAITPLGFAAKRTTLRDKLIRKAVAGNDRQPFSSLFFEDDFTKPLTYNQSDVIHNLLESVRRAPSASNKQPWKIISSTKGLHLYLDEDASYNHRFEPVLMQNIDMGIAMAHISLVADQKLSGKWTLIKSAPTHTKYTYISSWMKTF